jgi:membrane-bound lytic murein transglycosylase MltF
MHFSHAAYNAGAARVQQMRHMAKKMGLNSNVWFGNVEQAAWRIVGRETVQYVENIHKYYMAYELIEKKLETRGAVKKQFQEKRKMEAN